LLARQKAQKDRLHRLSIASRAICSGFLFSLVNAEAEVGIERESLVVSWGQTIHLNRIIN
jgi:hypothetical protein